MGNSYYIQQNNKETERLQEILSSLPPYVSIYFNSISLKQIRTRVGYARDLNTFFQYLHKQNTALSTKQIREISLDDLELLTPDDIEEYRAYLQHYQKDDGTILENDKAALARKMSALNGFFEHLVNRDKIAKNPMRGVDYPKPEKKPIRRLNQDEIYLLMQEVSSGNKMTSRQLKFHDITMVRDVAIISVLLGTGIRVTELVGLDIDDVNLDEHSLYVIRKGGNKEYVYFNDDVAAALSKYMYEPISNVPSDQPLSYRDNLFPYTVDYNEKALFLSLRGNRMAVRSVQTMVKKYAELIEKKGISAHKLRSTFGTALYNATGDAYTVSKALGHKNIETSKKYIDYAPERLEIAKKINILPHEE